MENKEATTTTTQAAAPVAATPAPVDENAIAEKAAALAVEKTNKLAEKRIAAIEQGVVNRITKALNPEQQGNDTDVQFLTALAKEPIKTMSDISNFTLQRAREADKAEREAERIQTETASKFRKEYPSLAEGNKAKIVDSLARAKMAEGKTLQVALDESFKETVSEFGLKSVADTQREQGYALGVPTTGGKYGGGTSGNKEYDSDKSSADFVQAQRARINSFKKR